MTVFRDPARLLRVVLLASGALLLAMGAALLAADRWQSADGTSAAQAAPSPTPLPEFGQQLAKVDPEQLYQGLVKLAEALAPTPTPTPLPPTPTPEPPAAPPASVPQYVESPSSPPAQEPQAPQAPPPASQPGCPTAAMSGYGLDLFNAVNAQRAANGMAALAANGCLVYVAQIRSDDMAANNYFSHTSPNGSTSFSLMDSFGIHYGWAGENLARNNYPGDQSVGVAINELMNSAGHRDNILHTAYRQIGVAVAIDGLGMKYFTMVFTD